MDRFRQDLGFALRAIVRRPGFTVLTASMLAIGLGANTAIFSVVNAVVLRPLPYAHPERLYVIGSLRGGRIQAFSAPEFLALRDQVRGFDEVATAIDENLNLTGEGEPERVAGARVTANLLPMLGVEPTLGRNFLPEEELEGRDAVVLVTHGAFRRRFGSDPALLGRRLKLDGREREVVGILPEGFTVPSSSAEILVPVAFTRDDLENPGGHFLGAIGRLAPGVTAETALAEADGVVSRAVTGFKENHRGPHGATGSPMLDFLLRNHESALVVLSASVGFVLLIVCANVANLLLARTSERRREIAMRGALGASRSRIVRQLLTESLLLASIGGVGGFLIALWGVDLIVRLSPEDVPRLETVGLDWSVFGFASAISLGAGLVFGLMPALEASRSSMERSLREATRSEASAPRRSRSFLVACEVALALILLVGAALTLESFWNLGRENPGFAAGQVLTARLVLPESRYEDGAGQTAFARRLLEEVRALPGVRQAGLIAPMPLSQRQWRLSLEIPGREPPPNGQPLGSNWRTVLPGYFAAMGIPLLAGRDFTDLDARSDDPEPRSTLVINETFARNHFPGEDALGKFVRIGYDELLCEIVGIVGDVRHADLASTSGDEMYTPFPATPVPNMDLALRVDGEPESLAGQVREAVSRVDPDQPVFGIAPLPDLVRASVAPRRFVAFLLLGFAAVAVFLALLGVYAVISHTVLSRTREIGIRMALGARASEVLGLVMTQGLSLVLAGAAAGLLTAVLLSRYLESQLYGVSGTDLRTYALVGLLLVVSALAATAVPALRASRVDPIQALRTE